MAVLTQKIKVSNDRSSFITLWLEPWGEDYGMSPGDEFEVVAVAAEEGFYFLNWAFIIKVECAPLMPGVSRTDWKP